MNIAEKIAQTIGLAPDEVIRLEGTPSGNERRIEAAAMLEDMLTVAAIHLQPIARPDPASASLFSYLQDIAQQGSLQQVREAAILIITALQHAYQRDANTQYALYQRTLTTLHAQFPVTPHDFFAFPEK